jgi:hypothetical protein
MMIQRLDATAQCICAVKNYLNFFKKSRYETRKGTNQKTSCRIYFGIPQDR